MLGQVRLRGRQAAQVDDALDTRRCRGGAEEARGLQVACIVSGTRTEAVHQVVGYADILQRSRQGVGAQHIAGRHLDVMEPAAVPQALRIAHQAPYAQSCFEQPRHQPATDVAGRTSHENATSGGVCHGRH